MVLCSKKKKMFSATLCSDILAIRCVNKHVCIGVGNCVHVYEIKNREFVAKLEVFDNHNIHGIVEGPENVLFVYGGKNLSICELKITEDKAKLNLSTVRRFDDWIIALGWTRHENDARFSILFAHNNLRFCNTKDEKTRTVWCKERCILYGGSVLAKNNGQTVVFSGTVFQEILIWQATNDREYANDVAILHRLNGHKGVIFSVVYDPVLELISSTSDDRTVRLWRVRNKILQDSNVINWTNCDISLTTTMYGHTARVWRSMVRDKKIISIGEDSLMCVWSLAGKLLDKVEVHSGAEVWSIDVSEDNKYIFTGGADGAVNVWSFESTDPQGTQIYSSDLGKIPKFVYYTKNRNILIFMDAGYLISCNKDLKSIGETLNLPRYSSYCVMQISPDRRKIGLGSKDGYIEIYEEIPNEVTWKLCKILEKKVTESKIFSFHWLSDEMILICCDAGQLKLIDIVTENVNIRQTFVLPTSRERWTTAAIVHENILICGDRAGSVYVFNLIHDDRDSLPARVFPKIHGRLGVQSFTVADNKILSTGRDGTLRFYEINDETRDVRTLHLNKMPMDWVCRILRNNGDIYVLGFKEIELMIYSMNLKRIVQRFVCGGGHRSWDCTIVDEKINFVYIRDKRVYELDSHLRNINLPIIQGNHTKEIYCVQPIENSSNHSIFVSASEDCTLRLTRIVENKKKKIQKYRIDTLETYDGHVSNVKSLAILNLRNNEKLTSNLVVSGGGRAQLKIWQINVTIDDETLTKNDVTCTELLSYMLRGTDKDRKKNWQNNVPAFFVDPETRFMDIKVEFYEKDSKLVVIYVACSDGFLRIFLYDIDKNILHTSNTVNYRDRCTLRVNTFVSGNETILMTMTTDGIVSFWRMNESIENLVNKSRDKMECDDNVINVPFSKMKIHQSGINSFDLREIDDSRWLMLTGGDDNLLSLAVVEIIERNNVLFADKLTSWNSSSVHSAQITGAKFVDDDRILSTGIDQRVVVYSYSYANDLLSVSQIEETMALVPDVQGVALCRKFDENDETLACVYGKGLEVIVLKSHTRCS